MLDFGLVKEIETEPDAEEGRRTEGGKIVGTPACMAPEVALGQKDVDGRADLYALGCVGYWLLTATLPFPGDSPVKTLLRHVTESPEPPGARSKRTLAPEIEQLVLSCLAKEPEDRPANAADLSARLRSLAVPRPWTQDDARQWWELHLPQHA